MTDNGMLISELLDAHWLAMGEVEAQREIADGKKWRASLLGSCLRRQYIELVDRRPYPPPDARTQRIFQVGHLTGELVARAFRSAGVLLEEELSLSDDELNVGAHVDFLIGGPIQAPGKESEYRNHSEYRHAVVVRERLIQKYGPVLPTIGVELKSKSSKSFWWAKKNKEQVAGANQLIQAACYDLLARRKGLIVDKWVVLSVSKDDLTMAEDEVTEIHRAQALHRLELLNSATSAQDLPCSCIGPGADFGKNTWKYCNYGVSETECC